jgi:hypothetical protein
MQARECFEHSGDKGNSDDQMGYGYCFHRERGASIDLRETALYDGWPPNQGNHYGESNLGIFLGGCEKGHGFCPVTLPMGGARKGEVETLQIHICSK